MMLRASLALSLMLMLAANAATAPLPDTLLSRVEILASIETLHAAILAGHSATKALETWCADRGWAAPAVVRAVRVVGADKPIRPALRTALQIGPDEPVRYRRVRLICGERTLSEADNWYVPARLTPEMNRLLDTTDTPFGKVVASLAYTRETLEAGLVWSPLPKGWERNPPVDHPGATFDVPPILFEHRALLFDATHRPISAVEEHYTRDILDFSRIK